jgi:hypothetical protein
MYVSTENIIFSLPFDEERYRKTLGVGETFHDLQPDSEFHGGVCFSERSGYSGGWR